jgi:23S rRNA pseudouridine2605 synthase
MRLNQFIAKAGIASRRKADELIIKGKVRVNQNPVKILGTKVADGDVVEVNGEKVIQPKNYVYYAVYKPVGYVSSMSDPLGRPLVVELVPKSPKVYPVGRLDIDSEGLIILTNDGDYTYKMTHPKNEIPKTYQVWIRGQITDRDLLKLSKGVKLNDGPTHPAEISRLAANCLEITIHEGRNRQIRRMLALLNYEVLALKRMREGEIKLEDLAEGEYRVISPI